MKTSDSLPVTISLASLVIFLAWQLVLSVETRSTLNRSLQNQRPLVGQSQQIQGSATQLLSDLIDLSEHNTNARAIVQKDGISRNPAPSN